MTIGALVYSRLTGYAGISALVSTRVYPLKLPQPPTLEAITYERVSNGPQNGTTDIRESRWQINCWAETYSEAHALARQVKLAFEEHKDTDQSPGIKQSYVVNEFDDYDDQPGVTGVYRTIVDVILVTTGD